MEVAPLEQLACGSAILCALDHTVVAMFNVDGHVFAVDDLCVRCGSSLAAGKLVGRLVTCSGCDWQYDVGIGCVRGVPALCIDTFEAKIVDGRVLVRKTAKRIGRRR